MLTVCSRYSTVNIFIRVVPCEVYNILFSRSLSNYRKISNTIRTLVQYTPQTFTGEPWENVSLAVQYAPVLSHRIQTCSLPYIVLLSKVNYSIVYFFIQTNKNVQNYLHFTSIKSMFIVFVNKTIGFPDPATHIGRFKCWNLPNFQHTMVSWQPACWT